MAKKEKKNQIKICLDEIEASYRIMVSSKSTKDISSKAKGWARKHRNILKELKYRGKIPRQPRITKKHDEGSLFDE
jgi:hypothetical protein